MRKSEVTLSNECILSLFSAKVRSILVSSGRGELATLAGVIELMAALRVSRSLTFAFSFGFAIPGLERRRAAFSHHSLPQLSSVPPSLPLFLPFFLLLALFASDRHHLSFCQLGDFNLLSFCAITEPRSPRKIVFNCDWLLTGGGRPPPFVPRFLHTPNYERNIAAESRPNEIPN